MTPFEIQSVRDEMILKRDRLHRAVRAGGSSDLAGLLREVDAALERIESGQYGICLTCGDPVEEDRLRQDPLICYCIDHMTELERRRLETDIERAARVQGLLMPRRAVARSGWDIHFHSVAAGPVSGDYCDIGDEDDGLEVAFGDVSGKGIAASLLAAHVGALFRAIGHPGVPVHDTVAHINRMMCGGSLAPHYATAVYARLSSDGGAEVCNAGHCPPALVRDGVVDLLPPHGLPLGMFVAAPYTSTRFDLRRGDALVLYTDGVIEAEDGAGAQYGVERLSELLALYGGRSAAEIAQACFEEVAGFRRGGPADDTSVLVMRRA